MTAPTVHATAIVIGETGVLIRGRSGSGKSSLALALVARVRLAGGFAAFVADDRVALAPAGGRLIGRAPATIAGLAERYGRGIEAVDHVPAAVIGLVVDLVEEAALERLPDPESLRIDIDGVVLARQPVPARRPEQAMGLILSALASSAAKLA